MASAVASSATSSFLNIHTLNFLRLGGLLGGLYYGYSHKAYLTRFVADRKVAREREHYAMMVEEAKIAFEAQENREMAEKGLKRGVEVIDANSYRFDGQKFIDLAVALAEENAPKKSK